MCGHEKARLTRISLSGAILFGGLAVLLAAAVTQLPPFVSAASEGTLTWTYRASMPTVRYSLGVAAATNGKVYTVGGYTGCGSAACVLSVLEEYDPATNTWTRKSDMPTPRTNLGFVGHPNGKLYAIGGSVDAYIGYTGTLEEYDPSTDTWRPRASMPTPRDLFGIAVGSNGRIYAVGGNSTVFGFHISRVEEYDPTTDTWAVKTSMTTPRSTLGLAGTPGGKLYAVGGENGVSSFTTTEEYDIASNTWVTKAPMPTPRTPSTVTVAGRVYAINGFQYSTGDGVTSVEVFNPEANTWSSATPTLTRRYAQGAALASNGRVYVIGGTDHVGKNEEGTIDLPPGEASTLMIQSGDSQNALPGSILPAPLVVKVADAAGNPVAGVPIAWRVSGMPTGAIGQRFGDVAEQIAYLSKVIDPDGDVWAMNTDGTAKIALTSAAHHDGNPSWSPDGARVAFLSFRDGNAELYAMQADGSGQTRLTHDPADDGAAAWSPDGTKIVFHSGRDATLPGGLNIYVMNADGSGVERLTTAAGVDKEPSWSPDGTQIAFSSNRGGSFDIYIMNSDGSEQTPLATGGGHYPSWSPDGSKIVFASYRDGFGDVWVINTDGSGETRVPVITGDSSEQRPSYSADGGRIAFNIHGPNSYDVAISNVDGTGSVHLTNNGAPEHHQVWSPAISITNPTGVALAAFTLGDRIGTYRITATCIACTSVKSVVFVTQAGNTSPNVGPIIVKVNGVSEVAPVIAVGTPIAADAGFTDPDVLDTHTAQWNWDDGSTSVSCPPNNSGCTLSEANGSGLVSGEHVYTAAGVYTLKLDVRDQPTNNPGESTPFEYVVVYDPAAGFVTGVGWIDSPAGACKAGPNSPCDVTVVGTAKFGFVSKYRRGASVPEGQTEFKFQAGNLDFHSDSYEWLLVSGCYAQYKGAGTVNGVDDYTFKLTARDGNSCNPLGQPDGFRLQLWKAGGLVYDNGLEQQDVLKSGTNPTVQEIKQGSIVIHTSRN